MKFMTGRQLNQVAGSVLIARLSPYGFGAFEVRVFDPCHPIERQDQRFTSFGAGSELIDELIQSTVEAEGGDFATVVRHLAASGESVDLGRALDADDSHRSNFADDELFAVMEPSDVRTFMRRLSELL